MRVVVVGAGIIGLAAAYHLAKEGARVTILDRDPGGDKASVGNAGGIAVTEVVPASVPGTLLRVFGWMRDPLGPLAVRPSHAPRLVPWLMRFARVATPREAERISHALSAINARVYDDLMPMLQETGLRGELHRAGALSVYETEEGYRRDSMEWTLKRSRGIDVSELTGAEAREMEPALGPRVHRAMFTPQWSHIDDPRRLLDGLRAWLLGSGVVIHTAEVNSIASTGAGVATVGSTSGSMRADCIVVAAGAWSASLSRCVGDRVLLESERGYNMTLPEPGVVLTRELIFAERKFVATPLSCGLRIGGAAEFGGLKAPANYQRSRALVRLARQYLPQLQVKGGTSWAGHRPATPDGLPVIGRSSRHRNVIYAFGHGHLGLTQAATTGKLVSELVFQKPTSIDLSPYSIQRFN